MGEYLLFLLLLFLSHILYIHSWKVEWSTAEEFQKTYRDQSVDENQAMLLSKFHVTNRKLFDDLLGDYHKELSPYYTNYHIELSNGSSHPPPMTTTATLTWLRIVKIDQVEQVMKIIAELRLIWSDYRLSWNPEDYGGIEHIYLSRSSIWVPELTVGDSELSFDVAPEYKQNVLVDHNGRVIYYLNVVSNSICPLSTHDFPFDKQNCPFCLIELLFNKNESNIEVAFSDRIDYVRGGNGEWDIIGTNITRRTVKDYSNVEFDLMCFDFILQRKSNFYVMVIVVPTFIITTLSITGVFAKRLSGDDFIGELSLGLTSLMTLTVMLGIVADSLPKTNSLPVLSVFLTVEVTLTALSVLVVIIHPRVLYPKIKAIRSKISLPGTHIALNHSEEQRTIFGRVTSLITKKYFAANLVFMLFFQSINFANLYYILSFWWI